MVIKKVSDIKPDKEQPRKTFDEEKLGLLASNIVQFGLINPIDIAEDGIIIDGERRWRACKAVGLKQIEVRIVKLKKDKVQRLKRQLISDLLDDKIPTEESYEAIVKLYKMMGSPLPRQPFCREVGLTETTLTRALNYINDKQSDPDAVEGFSAGVWREVRNLPKEEREEIKKELAETKEPFSKIVEQKKEVIRERKAREELERKIKEQKNEKRWEVKVQTTQEILRDMRDEIFRTNDQLNKMMFNIKRIRKTKFYLYKAKDKDAFFKVVDGAIQRVDKWSKELQQFKDEFQLEIVRE